MTAVDHPAPGTEATRRQLARMPGSVWMSVVGLRAGRLVEFQDARKQRLASTASESGDFGRTSSGSTSYFASFQRHAYPLGRIRAQVAFVDLQRCH